jgi:hypothetical protein
MIDGNPPDSIAQICAIVRDFTPSERRVSICPDSTRAQPKVFVAAKMLLPPYTKDKFVVFRLVEKR